jgi:hypothetical protein
MICLPSPRKWRQVRVTFLDGPHTGERLRPWIPEDQMKKKGTIITYEDLSYYCMYMADGTYQARLIPDLPS